MTITPGGISTAPAVQPYEAAPALPGRVWQTCRWAVLVAWLVAALAVVSGGAREDSWGSLSDALSSGSVTEVQVAGGLGRPDATGTAVTRLTWREHGVQHATEVTQRVGSGYPDGLRVEQSGVIIDGPIAPVLRQHSAADGLVVTPAGDYPTSSVTVFGWRITDGWGALVFLVWPLTWALMGFGPEPRTATAWAWFWLMLTPYGLLAALAYLLWGARGRVPGRRRLTGGWAFLLFLLAR